MTTHHEFGRKSQDRHGAGNTPFRYPGGKAFLADVLEARIQEIGEVTTYAEPFAGGAGAAIELLARGTVSELVLNDFDRRIHSAWRAIIYETDRFVSRLKSTEVNIETWHKCRRLVEDYDATSDIFELGFATYFLNRTNRSGVIIGAGPIGGYDQSGKWKIDARWYLDTMVKRVEWLGEMRKSITLSNMDGLSFIKGYDKDKAKRTFFFIDPPYVQAGAKLYMNAMSDLKHKDLAAYLTGEDGIDNWLVTYDDCPLVVDAYSGAKSEKLEVRYSLQNKRMESEVVFVPA